MFTLGPQLSTNQDPEENNSVTIDATYKNADGIFAR